MNVIPILLYHGITTDASSHSAPYSVSPDDFVRHLDLILERGFRCLTVSQLVDELRAPYVEKNDKVALITFDDGYADFALKALPALNARSLPATMFLTSGWLEGGSTEPLPRPEDRMLDWSQIPELIESNVEIGAHSHSHPQMDTLDTAAAVYELTRSKALIEDSISRPVRSFAYPHGYNSPRTRRLTAEAGYDSAVAVRNAFSHRTDDVYRLARLMLMNDTSVEQVAGWLDGKGAPKASAVDSPRTLGWRAYRRGKAFITGKPGNDYA